MPLPSSVVVQPVDLKPPAAVTKPAVGQPGGPGGASSSKPFGDVIIDSLN